jgi:hypothetical protein
VSKLNRRNLVSALQPHQQSKTKIHAALTAGTAGVALRRPTILLLTWVTSRTTLRRTLLLTVLLALRRVATGLLSIALLWRLPVLTSLGRLPVLASLGWLPVLLLALGRTVLARWRCAVLAALRWAAVTLLRRTSETTAWWAAVAARCGIGLLIL